MNAVMCCSVKIKSMRAVSSKAVAIETFDGSSDVFPKSQIFGIDPEGEKCEALWISEWILERKSIQWSRKKMRLVSKNDSGNLYRPPEYALMATVHIPELLTPVISNEIESLRRPV